MNKKTIGATAFIVLVGGGALMYSQQQPRVETVIPPIAAEAPVAIAEVAREIAPAAPMESEPATPLATAVQTSVPRAPAAETPPPALGTPRYIAKPGDTLSELAIGLLGQDSKANRDVVVSANPSLQANPDLVVAGQTYDRTVSIVEAAVTPIATPPAAVEPEPELKYTAKPGDTVSNLAGALLGGETKTNRDAIVNANSSLQVDADRVVAGKTYTIPAPQGLSAVAKIAPAVEALPTTRPDSDQIIEAAAARTLRYTAKPGDTVTSLAIALLGSDTKANRDAITNTNASLKANPDSVVAGQTYWIPAPVAEVRESH
jgi:LysM repeat protein